MQHGQDERKTEHIDTKIVAMKGREGIAVILRRDGGHVLPPPATRKKGGDPAATPSPSLF